VIHLSEAGEVAEWPREFDKLLEIVSGHARESTDGAIENSLHLEA
jgi:hypothetical protein